MEFHHGWAAESLYIKREGFWLCCGGGGWSGQIHLGWVANVYAWHVVTFFLCFASLLLRTIKYESGTTLCVLNARH